MLALGVLLLAFGVLRQPAHSQGEGTEPPTTAQLPNVGFSTTAGGTADSNDRMIAVTGTDITGTSILYVIDTQNPHIAVYQAAGGSTNMNMLKLVAARRIDLDLKLDGFNDRSEVSYKELEQTFVERGLAPRDE